MGSKSSLYRKRRFISLEAEVGEASFSRTMQIVGGLNEIVLESHAFDDADAAELLDRYLGILSSISGSAEDYLRLTGMLGDLLSKGVISVDQYDKAVKNSSCNRWL